MPRPYSICVDPLRRAEVDVVIREHGVSAAVERFLFSRLALYRHAAHVPAPEPAPALGDGVSASRRLHLERRRRR